MLYKQPQLLSLKPESPQRGLVLLLQEPRKRFGGLSSQALEDGWL